MSRTPQQLQAQYERLSALLLTADSPLEGLPEHSDRRYRIFFVPRIEFVARLHVSVVNVATFLENSAEEPGEVVVVAIYNNQDLQQIDFLVWSSAFDPVPLPKDANDKKPIPEIPIPMDYFDGQGVVQ